MVAKEYIYRLEKNQCYTNRRLKRSRNVCRRGWMLFPDRDADDLSPVCLRIVRCEETVSARPGTTPPERAGHLFYQFWAAIKRTGHQPALRPGVISGISDRDLHTGDWLNG